MIFIINGDLMQNKKRTTIIVLGKEGVMGMEYSKEQIEAAKKAVKEMREIEEKVQKIACEVVDFLAGKDVSASDVSKILELAQTFAMHRMHF